MSVNQIGMSDSAKVQVLLEGLARLVEIKVKALSDKIEAVAGAALVSAPGGVAGVPPGAAVTATSAQYTTEVQTQTNPADVLAHASARLG